MFQTNLRSATTNIAPLTLLALVLICNPLAQAQRLTVIHAFTGGYDGGFPEAGLTMDRTGNLYGTTFDQGFAGVPIVGDGKVFKLGSDGVFTRLYSFAGGTDGANPSARVIFGPNGSLYGTTCAGGGSGCSIGSFVGCGTVFNLRIPPTVCKTALCAWNETVLYRFTGGDDGGNPGDADIIFDQAGSIYGAALVGGIYGNCNNGDACGTVYKLIASDGGWQESVLHNFGEGSDGQYPEGVIFDGSGNLYGTTYGGGSSGNAGTVFQLTPSGSGWTESVLYNFSYLTNNGASPAAGLIFGQSGNNLYGATSQGGQNNGGTAFELMPSGDTWTFSLLYGFSEAGCCEGPAASLVMDTSGNLYGTTWGGGANQLGRL